MCSVSWSTFNRSRRRSFLTRHPCPACDVSLPGTTLKHGGPRAVCPSPHWSCGFSFQTRNETEVRTRAAGERAADTARERAAGRRENSGLVLRRHGASQELTNTKN